MTALTAAKPATIAPATGRAVWQGPAVDYRREGMKVLTAAEVAEIDAALASLAARGDVDLPAITPETFPLPTLGGYFCDLGRELRTGRGFLLLRGLPRERYTVDDLARIYFGLGAHIGRPLPQSWQGELLGHVIDVSDIEANARGYHAGGGQAFHTDNCDVVALMCLRAARSGGASRIASAGAVHNALLSEQPELAAALYGDWVFRRMELDAQHGTGRILKTVSIFAQTDGELSCNISGSYPRRAAAAGDAVLSPTQLAALDAVQRVASSPETYLDMDIGEGDIQFLNNRLLLHGRTSYTDWPEVARRRHLMRLWLEVPSWPRLPAHQGMHAPEDQPLWLRQRTKLMELPSRYLTQMSARKAEMTH
jgi:hypothetical protein